MFFQECYGSRVSRVRIAPGSGRSNGLPVYLMVDRLMDQVDVVLFQRDVRFEAEHQPLSLARLACEEGDDQNDRLDRYGHCCAPCRGSTAIRQRALPSAL